MGLIEYDRRHGWRGPAGHVDLPAHGTPDYDALVEEYAAIGNLSPAVVTTVEDKSAHAYVKGLGPVEIDWDGLSWARRELHNEQLGPAPCAADQVLSKISPNVSVWAVEPDQNSLGEYLASLASLTTTLPYDVLVLPGHGVPFYGLKTRIKQLADHHEERCRLIADACRETPQTSREPGNICSRR